MMAAPVLVPLEKDEYYYGKIGDRKLRRRVEWWQQQRYDWIIEPWPPKPKRKRKTERAKPIREKEQGAGAYDVNNRPIGICVYYDCSDLAGGATFIVHTQYGTRCAEVLATPMGNMLVCISCCGSPIHDEKRKAWRNKYAEERIYRERKRLAKSLPMAAALHAKMRKKWGLEE